MKKIKLILAMLILMGIGYAVKAQVEKRSVNQTKYIIDMKPGDRIIIVKAGYTRCYTRIEPKEARKLDVKVEEGKTLNGTLNYR